MDKIRATFWVFGLGITLLIGQACQQAEQPAAGTEEGAAPESAAAPAPDQPYGSGQMAANAPSSPAAATQARSVPLAAGTALKVRTTRTLSTKTLKTGDSFDAVLDAPLMAGNREIAPKGATVMGTVVDSDPGGRVKGVASLSIALNMLHTPDGQVYDIATNTITVDANTSKTKDATKVAIGTGIGAAIGAIAGGGKGAAVGAATGAGAGTGVVLATRGDPAEIPTEAVLDFSLSSPVTVNLAR